MTDEAFLRAIAESPRDDTHRLVYADWLEEHGDPRSEWLRLQQTLAVADAGRYRALCAREQELWRTLDPVWLHAVRRYTTAPPCRDIADLVPALAPFARTTTRLHPRRAPAPLPAWMSKIGGLFLWPETEHWPECPECRVPLAPVIQLRSADVPLIEFPPGMDLFQLFWCAAEGAHNWQPVPTVFWRAGDGVTSPRTDEPRPPATTGPGGLVPVECSIYPEAVVEYPVYSDDLSREIGTERAEEIRTMLDALDLGPADDLGDRFSGPRPFRSAGSMACCELGECPGSKAGGGFGLTHGERPFDHFLTLSTNEYDMSRFRRWTPLEEQRLATPPGEPMRQVHVGNLRATGASREATGLMLGRSQRVQLHVRRDRLPWTFLAWVGD